MKAVTRGENEDLGNDGYTQTIKLEHEKRDWNTDVLPNSSTKTVQAQNMTRGQNNNFQSHNSSTQTLQAQNISKGINQTLGHKQEHRKKGVMDFKLKNNLAMYWNLHDK